MRFYKTWQEETDDQFSEWFWREVVGKGILGFIVVSAPVFLVGAVVAPQGTDRLSYATEKVGEQHTFLWSHLGGGIQNTINVLAPIVDNGSSDDDN